MCIWRKSAPKEGENEALAEAAVGTVMKSSKKIIVFEKPTKFLGGGSFGKVYSVSAVWSATNDMAMMAVCPEGAMLVISPSCNL